MCIAGWVWQRHPLYSLFLLFNRDERLSRQTDPAGWWRWGSKMILGGRDVEAGGTWLACSKEGRVAFLTNVREKYTESYSKSRGELPCKFLESEKNPGEFANDLVKVADEYKGFNLIIADIRSKSMVHVCNRPHKDSYVQELPLGVYVVTNGKPGLPSLKIDHLLRNLNEALDKYCDGELNTKEMVDQLMGDKVKAGIKIPLTCGWDKKMECELSSVFIDSLEYNGAYGTRNQAALSFKLDGEAELYERYLDGDTWKEHSMKFKIEMAQN